MSPLDQGLGYADEVQEKAKRGDISSSLVAGSRCAGWLGTRRRVDNGEIILAIRDVGRTYADKGSVGVVRSQLTPEGKGFRKRRGSERGSGGGSFCGLPNSQHSRN